MSLARLLAEDGSIVCGRCEFAVGIWSRTVGLLGRRNLAAGHGLAVATSAIHTCGMRFPIDVVFCDGELNVLKVVRDLPAWRVAGARRARTAFELPAGAAAGVHVGDRLTLDTIEA
jgi:hypothetical protein